MKTKINKCPWDRIGEFLSRAEFDRFVTWISNQVVEGEAKEIPIAHPFLNATSFTEKWYRHIGSGDVWRLVWPDGPFHGLFEKVSQNPMRRFLNTLGVGLAFLLGMLIVEILVTNSATPDISLHDETVLFLWIFGAAVATIVAIAVLVAYTELLSRNMRLGR